VLDTAYRLGASDVFLDDEGGRIAVRFRLSGVAEVFPPIPTRHRATFMAALKRMSSVNPNARSDFHDARFGVDFSGGTRVDIRAAFAPTLSGETVALRLQDSKRMVGLNLSVPLPPAMLDQFNAALAKKGGMVLVTGPTGSGKTTTLYAALLSMDRADLVIRTIEDPVEYTLPGITQVPVGGDTGRTFGGALRSFLRLNPDVILVGEIRDEETVKLAVEAGLTGHTLLSTLHAPDCVSTITRLLSLVDGEGPQNSIRVALKATLGVILSQRLAPRLCQDCKEPRKLVPAEVEMFHRFNLPPPPTVYRRRGCPKCGTGLRGRVPVFELMVTSPKLLDVMTSGSTFASEDFRKQWLAEGGEPIGRCAYRLAAEGLIECEEAKKLTVWVPPRAIIEA
jgi:type II secretory ATPase GspE/PulE/Tfp pilus assembly ATPase PilB-like protein